MHKSGFYGFVHGFKMKISDYADDLSCCLYGSEQWRQ